MATDRILQAELIDIASARTDDALWAAAHLISAAAVVLGDALGDREAGEVILGTIQTAVTRARH